MMPKCRIYFKSLILLLLVIFMASCSGSSSTSLSSSNAAPGTLGILLTDAPNSDFDAVYVTVSKVRVHQSASASENDPGWSEITIQPKRINLLDLANGVLWELGVTSLPAGHYTQLRLVLIPNTQNTGTSTDIANSVVVSSGTTTTEIPLITPSAVQNGIKLINEFDVAPGQLVKLVLDFDALKSIVSLGNGNYLLKPVISVTVLNGNVIPIIPTVLNGIDGFVDPALLGSNVMVSAQVNGAIVISGAPNAQTGEFFLAPLAPGNYDVVITADGRATAVIADVPISGSTGTVVVSTSAEPISLPISLIDIGDPPTRTISGTITLSPPSTSVVAHVAAKQIFPSGPTITVQSQAADAQTGVYSLALPIGAPLLGQYGTGTLPIIFSDEIILEGIYTVEASAAGYVTQSASQDISFDNATQDFTLMP